MEEYILEMVTADKEIFKVKLLRAIAPLTIFEIIKKLPLKATLLVYGKKIYIPIEVSVKGERSLKRVSKGDVTYSGINKSIIIHLDDEELLKPETKIGEALNIESLSRIKSGTSIVLRRSE